MKIKVLFFGMAAEKCGAQEKLYEGITSSDELKYTVVSEFPALANQSFAWSLNKKIIKENKSLSDGDIVAVLPPFSGG